MNKQLLILTMISLLSVSARANVCGTDYQSFNPTTNGLDFVTVQSSETLSPCIVNMGLFFNYAANSLTYSKTLNAGFQNGQKRQDRILGADLGAGIGLSDRWDMGVNIPFLLNQSVRDDYYVSSFEENGATEIKANTKYRILGDANGGVAAIFSINQNLLENNPFAGDGAGPTFNYELVADTVFASKWAGAVNVGYRDRNPGSAVAGVPFVPMNDQWIYSVAGSYLIPTIDTKLILELYGSHTAKEVSQDTDRNLNSLEALLGAKYDYSQGVALHFGGSHQIDPSLGGADWRVYAGVNWAVGPLCKDKPVEKLVITPSPAPQEPENIKLDVQFVFKLNSDVVEPVRLLELEDFFEDILKLPFERLVIEGHTDSIGTVEYNQDLSERRAANVRKYFIERYKLTPGKVEALGHGQSRPVADNGNYQGRRQNRRVELNIYRSK